VPGRYDIVPQYRLNVHLAKILSEYGFPITAENRVSRFIPDFTILHHKVGRMIGEAEISRRSDKLYDEDTIKTLEERARSRFDQFIFKGVDFILLIIYPRDLARNVKYIDKEDEVAKILRDSYVGVGLAARQRGIVEQPHFKWYEQPVEVVNVPKVLDEMIDDYFRSELGVDNLNSIVEKIINVIDIYSRNLAKYAVVKFGNFNDPCKSCNEKIRAKCPLSPLCNIAEKVKIAWKYIPNIEDRVILTSKFLLLISTLLMIAYELARGRAEGSQVLPPCLKCDHLNPYMLGRCLKELLKKGYKELNEDFADILDSVPDYSELTEALRTLCDLIREYFDLLKRGGWDLLAMLYQRLL